MDTEKSDGPVIGDRVFAQTGHPLEKSLAADSSPHEAKGFLSDDDKKTGK
jgi:hypothetical protein